MECKFPLSDIPNWAARYFDDPSDDVGAEQAGAAARNRGHLSRDELVTLADWKSPRTRPHIASNDDNWIHDVTRLALSTPSERLRIESLTLLRGVGWPMASVILHFCHTDPYPILDFRALWALGAEEPEYDFSFWQTYTRTCRNLAARAACDMRTLDRALWAYSKANQR